MTEVQSEQVTQANGHALTPLRFASPVADEVLGDATENPAAVPVDAARPERAPLRARIHGAATHKSTKGAARQGVYVLVGGRVVVRRTWEARSTARHQRMMRVAEATGDHELAKHWEQRAEHHREARHKRRMAVLAAPIVAARSLVYGAVGLFGLGVVLTLAGDHASPLMPLVDVGRALEFAFSTASRIWDDTRYLLPAILAGALWNVGRNASQDSTGWVSKLMPVGQDAGIVVSADGIVQALKALPVKELKAAYKAGWVPTFTTTPIKDGQGYRAILELPLDVTPKMVADQRERFARALHRAPIEVWAVDANRKGTGAVGHLDLWVADPGVLNKPAPEYPLLNSGTADVFEGVPGGVTPRGDMLMIPVVSNNFVAGGMMGQGKSNACRVVMLGCALDPLCELRVYVFAGNGDFDAYRPRLSVYERGADRATVVKGINGLRWLYAEVARRENRLAEIGAKKVTREIARKYPDLRPIATLFSECHELFGDKEFGEEAAELGVQTIRRARKCAMWLGFDTQSSRKDAIPPKIVELVSVNSCFAVKSWRSNDGFLGDGSFQAGIRATELRPGTDRGRSLITGVSDEPFEILNWCYIAADDDTGWDAATEVIARAVTKVAKGTKTAGEVDTEPDKPEPRDVLEDLLSVLGDEPTPAAQVVTLLKGVDPVFYGSLKKREHLTELLAGMGHKVPSTGNVYPMTAGLVREFMAKGATAAPAEDDSDAS